MINLNYGDPRPIYEQIRDGLRRLIVAGAMPEGERLPSVRSLAASLAINPNTIQRAYNELEAEGYISSIPGKGSFAAPRDAFARERRERLFSQFDGVVAELFLLGIPGDTLCARIRQADHGPQGQKEDTQHD